MKSSTPLIPTPHQAWWVPDPSGLVAPSPALDNADVDVDKTPDPWGNFLVGASFLIAGAWLGYALVTLVVSVPPITSGQSVGILWLLIALVPMLAAPCFAFQTPRRDVLMTIGIVGIAFVVMFLIGAMVSSTAGVLLGTLLSAAVGVVLANLWNRQTGRPTSIMMAPLAMLLASGSIGFRGLAAITTGQTALGVQQFPQMFIIAIAIGIGGLVGNSIVRPQVTL